jgi:spermidine synthase
MPTWHPYIVEDDEHVSLQFEEWDIQSRMRRSAPDELVLSYTQAMMAFLLFMAAPRQVLIAGLGGGSLAKFCYRHLPATRITSVEISQEVIALRSRFHIPPDDDRFQVTQGDFADFIDGKTAIADVILLDGYDAEGIPASLAGSSFNARCKQALTTNGILVANINLGALNNSVDARRALEQAVGKTVAIRSAAGHNDILLAFRDEALADMPDVPALKARAIALREQTGMDFPLLLDKVRSAAAASG